MKYIYVLSTYPYHDNGEILGVFSSFDAAERRAQQEPYAPYNYDEEHHTMTYLTSETDYADQLCIERRVVE